MHRRPRNDTGTFVGMARNKGVGLQSNQYFRTQVVAISTFRNYEPGNLSKHWNFGRGGGDRTLSPQRPKSLNQFTREHRFGATWGQKVRHLLHCRTLRIADNVTINSQRDPRIRMTQLSLGSTQASCNRGWRNLFTVA